MKTIPLAISFALLIAAHGSVAPLGAAPAAAQQSQQPAASNAARPIGTIKAISAGTITLTSDAGPLFTVAVQDSTKYLRIEPGAKDLKNAQPLHLEDLHEGDRILVMGDASADPHSVMASSVIVMKKADVEVKQQRDLQDWQRRGVGGLVSDVDAAAGTVTISTASTAGAKSVTVKISKDTIVRRYAPDSVKFDDATPSNLSQIKIGDQLRARGMRSADASEFAAEEIVTGAFRNISGTVSSIDPASNTLTVSDLATKKPVLVKVTAESQVRKLPPQMAQIMARRLKGPQAGATSDSNPADGTTQPNVQGNSASDAVRPSGGRDAMGGRGPVGGGQGGGDLQQMLSRIPPTTLANFQKGDAVMIVSTEGTASGAVTAITLVGGVEPILEASPNGSGQGMILPPWSLDAPTGDAGSQ